MMSPSFMSRCHSGALPTVINENYQSGIRRFLFAHDKLPDEQYPPDAIHLIESINRSCRRNYMRATNNPSSSLSTPRSSSVLAMMVSRGRSSVLASTRTMAKIALENWHVSRMYNISPSSDGNRDIQPRALRKQNFRKAGEPIFRFAWFVSNYFFSAFLPVNNGVNFKCRNFRSIIINATDILIRL